MTPTRSWLAVAGAALAVLLIAGGVYVVTQGNGGEPSTGPANRADGGSSNGSGGGADSEPGSDPTISPEPRPSEPSPTDDASTPDPNAVAFDAWKPTRTGMRVHYYIGVPECYGTVSDIEVEETKRQITVQLTRTPPEDNSDVACIEIALSKTADVTLQQEVGDRRVVDSTTGKPVRQGPWPGADDWPQ